MMFMLYNKELMESVTRAGQEALKQLKAKLLEHGILIECKTILTY